MASDPPDMIDAYRPPRAPLHASAPSSDLGRGGLVWLGVAASFGLAALKLLKLFELV